MSLADELLADLEENEQDELELEMDTSENPETKEEKQDVKEVAMEQDTTQITSVRELCKLRDSQKLMDIMNQMSEYGN